MKLIVLDDFPLWSTYLLGLVVLCGFLFSLAMLIRSLSIDEGDSRRFQVRRDRRRQLWFFVIAGALAVWFLTSSMYLQFHAVRLGSHELQLIFFWPRPPVNLDTQDVVDIKLVRAYRTCGHLEVARREELFRSVNFRRCQAAEEIMKTFSPRASRSS
jgi:hypothetical protein